MSKLRGINTDVKGLSSVVEEISANTNRALEYACRDHKDESYVLVVHLSDSDSDKLSAIATDIIERVATVERSAVVWREGFESLRGILFVKQMVYAGLTREIAAQLAREYCDRVHVLSYPLKTLHNGERCEERILARFESFREKLNTLGLNGCPPWYVLEPPAWPEDAVAVYLALIATERGVPDVLEAITSATWSEADERMKELSEIYADQPWEGFDLEESLKNVEKLDAMRKVFAAVAEEQKK